MLFHNFDPLFDKAIQSATSATLQVALMLIPLFILIEAGIATVRYFISDGERFVDFRKFFGQILIWFFATQFMSVMGFLDGFVNTIEYSIRSNMGDINLAASIADAQNISVTDAASDSLKTEEGFWSFVHSIKEEGTKMVTGMMNLPNIMLGSILKGGLWVVRVVVELISYILTSVLFIVGPLAIAFGMMPFVGQGITQNWFSTWFSIKCWVITMTILDFLLSKFVEILTVTALSGNLQALEDSFSGHLVRSAFLGSFVIIYLMTPFITNLYVKGAGGQFMSMAVGGAVMLTKAVATGGKYLAVKAASAAASGGKSNS